MLEYIIPLCLVGCGVLFGVYWLPKKIFISGLNKYFPSILTHVKTKSKVISITIDDAPYEGFLSEKNTLDETRKILKKYDAKVTFFLFFN